MTIERARQLRKSMSPAEARMWTTLRAEPIKHFHFRRQRQIGPYYVDFVSLNAKLVIEVDGSQRYEDGAIAYDARRTQLIEAEGYSVLRFATTDVLHHPGDVRALVMAALRLTD